MITPRDELGLFKEELKQHYNYDRAHSVIIDCIDSGLRIGPIAEMGDSCESFVLRWLKEIYGGLPKDPSEAEEKINEKALAGILEFENVMLHLRDGAYYENTSKGSVIVPIEPINGYLARANNSITNKRVRSYT